MQGVCSIPFSSHQNSFSVCNYSFNSVRDSLKTDTCKFRVLLFCCWIWPKGTKVWLGACSPPLSKHCCVTAFFHIDWTLYHLSGYHLLKRRVAMYTTFQWRLYFSRLAGSFFVSEACGWKAPLRSPSDLFVVVISFGFAKHVRHELDNNYFSVKDSENIYSIALLFSG